ncbi:MAG TPA: exodeoxyribonuclease VII large subunit [Lachnospiraceae bacterium]|uniref:exodeoxyribonuclease VII large subunit n=1 Tax=Anaerosporobacter sp. TaxID=1872529 RepID=UPI000EC8E516|nr:exodeoxyribonuclease VII large subunit [Anaerosporobacter sp.]HAB60858.1 exodeoxyribonuclease VII large subunit [Lachnospiraceae bacterium]
MDHVYTVTQINLYIKDMFARDYALNRIYVKGEVSNCKYHTSGHIYFTLKDSKGQMACVMFAGQRSGLAFRLQEGQSVIVLGSISVYERDGKYQMYAREILLDGAGVLYQKFEELKKQLDIEGLFDQEFKKSIKQYPNKVGIVTAKTGAAIQDMINVTTRRNPYVQLILYPALVQGEAAAASIVKGIKYLDSYGVDTIIVGRGGGSIEDLWAFNEEVVARAIFSCNTPIISAVGHETDTTIADYVADLRAPTPSAAAELVTGDIRDLFDDIQSYKRTLQFHMRQKLQIARNQLRQYQLQLEHASPLYQVNQKRQYLMDRENRLQYLMKQRVLENRHRLDILTERMKGLSPLDKLSKGYAIVTDEKQNVIRSVNGLTAGDAIKVELMDGDVTASVMSIQSRRRE